MDQLRTMIKQPNSFGNRVSGARKAAGNCDPSAVECNSVLAQFLKEAVEVSGSIGRHIEYPATRTWLIKSQDVLEYWLKERIQRDAERLVSLRSPKVNPANFKLYVCGKQLSLT